MELHNLKPAKNSVKSRKRAVGRGEGSKKGGTSTRGHKGAKSRSSRGQLNQQVLMHLVMHV